MEKERKNSFSAGHKNFILTETAARLEIGFAPLGPATGRGTDAPQWLANMEAGTHEAPGAGSIATSCRLAGESAIEFSVSDTGIGIPPDKTDSLFKRFIKLNPCAQGTGLGLAMCKSIVEQMHGRLGAESSEDAGSRCRFALPYDSSLTTETTD